jgi:hypothetical protein
MSMFVHLTPESRVALIRRDGLGRVRKGSGSRPGGLFAMPVTRDFFVTHQWLRELRRSGQGPMVGVCFRLPDDEAVWVGRYNEVHRRSTAAQATAEFLGSGDRMGWEVIIPRRIAAGEIRRIRPLRQLVGWRFFPGAKGRPPFCTCKFCTRGEYGARRLRERLGAPD